jgi:type IX secretion system PorP/SprF family membrane protein
MMKLQYFLTVSRNQSLYLEYAYKIQIGKGVLSIGADVGFLNLSFAVDSVDTGAGQDEYHDEVDSAIPSVSGGSEKGASGMGFDMGVGVYYTAPRWWASASYAHVTQPRLQWGSENTEVSVKGTMYLAGGYNWQLKNKDWMLLPSLMVMTDFTSWDVNLTLLTQLKKRYRFGLGYRIAGSVNILLGLDIVDGLQLGYTYELPANALIKESFGSHELYLAYGFKILKPKNTNKYKSVRYL